MDYYQSRNGSIMQIVNCSLRFDDKNCKSGLVHNYQTMRIISAFGPIITSLLKISFRFPNWYFVFVLSGNICCDIIKFFR